VISRRELLIGAAAIVAIPKTQTHGMGHIRDGLLRSTHAAPQRFIGSIPDTYSFANKVDRIRDQGGVHSCVGQALARALHIVAGGKGKYPSALGIYTIARMYRYTGPLTDGGSVPALGMYGMRDWGVCAEEDWYGDINEEPGWTSIKRCSEYTAIVSHRVFLEDIRKNLAKDIPVCVSIVADQAFQDHRGTKEIGDRKGPKIDNHFVCAVGYRPGAVLVVNSWGDGWGDGGFAWIADERLRENDDSISVVCAPSL
jgi:hypothetical protein